MKGTITLYFNKFQDPDPTHSKLCLHLKKSWVFELFKLSVKSVVRFFYNL